MGLVRIVKYEYEDFGATEYTILPYMGSPDYSKVGRKGKKQGEVSQEYIDIKIRRNKTKLRRIAMANDLHRHMVLTFKNAEVYKNNIDHADDLLKEFFKKLRNIFPEVKYIATREMQSRGVLHYHILINQFLPVNKLNLCWNGIDKTSMKGMEEERTFKGYVSIVCHDSTVKAINYVAKYMVKEAQQMSTQNGYSKKMYLSSKGIKGKVDELKTSVIMDEELADKIMEDEFSWFMTNCKTEWDVEHEIEIVGADKPLKVRSLLFSY